MRHANARRPNAVLKGARPADAVEGEAAPALHFLQQIGQRIGKRRANIIDIIEILPPMAQIGVLDFFGGALRGLATLSAKKSDVVIVGAGHNGLIAAALLARQGLQVQGFHPTGRQIRGGWIMS